MGRLVVLDMKREIPDNVMSAFRAVVRMGATARHCDYCPGNILQHTGNCALGTIETWLNEEASQPSKTLRKGVKARKDET